MTNKKLRSTRDLRQRKKMNGASSWEQRMLESLKQPKEARACSDEGKTK